MRKLIYILVFVVAIPVLLVLAIGLLLANPDLYRDRLTDTFEGQTGLELKIHGDIGWRYWPLIALDVNDLAIHPPGKSVPLAEFKRAAIDLELLPLLFGSDNIGIDGIILDGLRVNLEIDQDGNANWVTDTEEATTEAEPTTGDRPTGDTFDLSITRIEITDARIDYRDHSAKQHYNVEIASLTTGPVFYDEPVDIEARFFLEDKVAGMTSRTHATGQLTFNSAFDQFTLDGMNLDNIVNMPDLPELRPDAVVTGQLNMRDGDANIEKAEITLDDLTATMSITANDLNGTPHYAGTLKTSTFNARKMLTRLKVELPEMANEAALSSVEVSTNIAGELPMVRLERLLATMDDTLMKGNVTLTLEDKTGLEFDLDIDRLNVSDYLPPVPEVAEGDEASATADNSEPADVEVIPVEALNEYAVAGQVEIGEFIYDTYQFAPVTVTLNNQQQKLTADIAASGYEGNLKVGLSATTGSNTSGQLRFNVADLNITRLTEWEWITGTLNADSNTRFTGRMLSEILDSIDGPTGFNIIDGTLDVTPIKALAADIDNLRGKTSSISEWPDKMSFEQLNGKHQLNNGISQDQVFGFQVENLNVAGMGGVDYWQNQLAYDIEVSLEETESGRFHVNPRLAGIGWPLHCEGRLDASPADMCRPDSKGVQKLVTEALKEETKRKALDKLEEKIPEDAKELLKGIFKR